VTSGLIGIFWGKEIFRALWPEGLLRFD
jgi:hypothetical protein